MFQGSESLEKLAHFRHVQGSGGVFNGSTHQDYTDYFEVLPAAALERALFLEADRLRAPKLTDGEPAQPGRRRQGGDPAQRPEPALRRVPLDPAAAGPLRHLPQRAQRLRRLLRAGAGLPRRRRGVLRHLLRAGQRAGHGRRLPRTSTRRCALVEKHFGDIPARAHARSARRSPSRRRAPSAARPCPTRTPRCPPSPSATGCPTRSPTSTATSATRCWARCSATARPPACSAGSCTSTGWSPTSRRAPGLMGPLDARDPDTFTITAVHPAAVDPDRVLARRRRGARQARRRRPERRGAAPARWRAGRRPCTRRTTA